MHAPCSYGVAQLSLTGSVPGAQFGGAGLRQIWPSLALCASNLMPMEIASQRVVGPGGTDAMSAYGQMLMGEVQARGRGKLVRA